MEVTHYNYAHKHDEHTNITTRVTTLNIWLLLPVQPFWRHKKILFSLCARIASLHAQLFPCMHRVFPYAHDHSNPASETYEHCYKNYLIEITKNNCHTQHVQLQIMNINTPHTCASNIIQNNNKYLYAISYKN
jgi:hypothetical protein